MSAIVVTYTVNERKKIDGSGYFWNDVTLAFDTGTYGTGVALTGANLGFPGGNIKALWVEDNGSDGLVYNYDVAHSKIRAFQVPASSSAVQSLAELGTGATPNSTLRCMAIGW